MKTLETVVPWKTKLCALIFESLLFFSRMTDGFGCMDVKVHARHRRDKADRPGEKQRRQAGQVVNKSTNQHRRRRHACTVALEFASARPISIPRSRLTYVRRPFFPSSSKYACTGRRNVGQKHAGERTYVCRPPGRSWTHARTTSPNRGQT